jgi:hypothetical protein
MVVGAEQTCCLIPMSLLSLGLQYLPLKAKKA